MATPRSLRSFFDFTTPNLLDADFSTLQLISRASHDALQTELATLRSQIAEKDAMLSTMFIQQHATAAESKPPSAAEPPIDFGIREAHVESLTAKIDALSEQKRKLALALETAQESHIAKVDALAEQKRKLTLALETAQAKSRALAAEVKNMRERQAREEHEKKYAALEAQYRTVASELEARRAENDRFALERSTLTAKVRALESGGGLGAAAAAAAVANREGMEALKTENERLMLRLKAFEDGNAALNKNIAAQNKTIGVLKTVANTNERCNVDLQKKNLDLVAEINAMETQYEETMKKNIVLERKNGELEDEKAVLEDQLKKLAEKSETASKEDTQQIEGLKKKFEESEKTLRAKINQLQDNIKRQVAAFKQYQEKTQYLTENNARFLEDKKAVEKKLQSVQVERARLDSELIEIRVKLFRTEKTVTTTSARGADLEVANKKLIDQNQYLSRRFETQTQTQQSLKSEIVTLEERSERMLGEIHTLRQDKARLNDNIDNLISQLNGRRGSTERNDQLELFPTKLNGTNNSNGSVAKPLTPISPGTTRGTKRTAEDQDDTAQTPTTSRSNFTIRALADTPKVPQAAQPIPTHPPPSPPQRSLFDRVKQPSQQQQSSDPRSLFDRINTNTSIDHEIDTLITASKDSPRGVFCRLRGPPPGVADLLDLISGGPLESVRIALEKDVAFLWFLRPSDASAFMTHSAVKKLPNVEFAWNEKPVRMLDRDLATQVVRYGASRVFILHCVPNEVPLQRIASDVGGKRIAFWLCEGATGRVTADGRTKGREVVIEFTELRDAVEARKRLGGDFWCEASWMREGCDRTVPKVELL
ncbi:uncharacterized protein LAJ45_04660 [Morchella importuna]|nr:uncharacterized protein LAJ45_04660 [Morchella importuna]KAH8151455.1 hypothetical protein LAJ45_04660 [Morchella importuna]